MLFLVRHPLAAIAAGICYGRLDVGLSAEGEAQLAELAATLPRGPVWTSPARRCRRLADLLSPAPRVDPRLQELDFGDWEGARWDDIPRAALDRWAAAPASFAPPGGETGEALLRRVEAVCRELPADAVVVTHGGPLRLMAALLRGDAPDLLAPPPPPGSVTRIDPHVRHASQESTAQSVTTAQAPSTSPVNPPI